MLAQSFEILHESWHVGGPNLAWCMGCQAHAWHMLRPSARPPGSSPPTWEMLGAPFSIWSRCASGDQREPNRPRMTEPRVAEVLVSGPPAVVPGGAPGRHGSACSVWLCTGTCED